MPNFFQDNGLTPQNFWQLVELFSNLDKTKAYAAQIKESTEQAVQAVNALNAREQELAEKYETLSALTKAFNDGRTDYDAAKAKWENDQFKIKQGLLAKQSEYESALARAVKACDEADAKSISLTQRSEQLEAAYKERSASLDAREAALTAAESALKEDQAALAEKQKALKAALNAV